MNSIIITLFAILCATPTSYGRSNICSEGMEFAYPSDIPWVEDRGRDYIFTRQKYNSVCVDSNGEGFEYGTIQGVYTYFCSTFCLGGISLDLEIGCSSRPPATSLVGFEYNCESTTCKCLYEAGTLSDEYENCFDDINTSNSGTGQVTSTIPREGETCYSLSIESNKNRNNPPPSPTPRSYGTGICAYTPDYECYITGRPACCSDGGGESCPDYLTMCDNHAEDESGFDYCEDSPNLQCYNTDDGRPSCCSEPGGSLMNCPQTRPTCDVSPQMKYLRSDK